LKKVKIEFLGKDIFYNSPGKKIVERLRETKGKWKARKEIVKEVREEGVNGTTVLIVAAAGFFTFPLIGGIIALNMAKKSNDNSEEMKWGKIIANIDIIYGLARVLVVLLYILYVTFVISRANAI